MFWVSSLFRFVPLVLFLPPHVTANAHERLSQKIYSTWSIKVFNWVYHIF
ncbi:hypothetical protein GLYMA_14G069950v4 [Glycine max]|nr:hypothetical protein GLYMA_14G069950v4 [Glycine max]KAH1093416.1 hypothetical protein GYH30_039258 [Glycine max]